MTETKTETVPWLIMPIERSQLYQESQYRGILTEPSEFEIMMKHVLPPTQAKFIQDYAQEFKTLEKWLETMPPFLSFLNKENIETLKDYVKDSVKTADFFRNLKVDQIQTNSHTVGKSDILISQVFSRIPTAFKNISGFLPTNTILFQGRGPRGSEPFVKNIKTGLSFLIKEPISTSWHPNSALAFARISGSFIVYHVGENIKGLPIPLLSDKINGGSTLLEREILLPPHLTATILSYEPHTDIEFYERMMEVRSRGYFTLQIFHVLLENEHF